MNTVIEGYALYYKEILLNEVVPFWENNSPDWEFGGYFTCLDRQGKVYDTDKFIWLQGREAWTFAMLYEKVESNSKWLEMAKLGVEFLRDKARSPTGDFYFSTTRSGVPLVQPYNVFSDCFAALAFNQYGIATNSEEYLQLAKETFEQILARQLNPKGIYEKAVPGSRPLRNFALPMILSNLCLELQNLLDPRLVSDTLDACVKVVMKDFLDQERGLIFENRTLQGEFSDSFEGRLLNPGHGMEAMWFMMDIASRHKDHKLLEQAKEMTLSILSKSWDEEFGGIFYFLDSEGHSPQQLEWDQKLWWVHLESMVALMKAYELTGDSRCLDWFEKVHRYAWAHFHDTEYGEWFGYLNRRGEVLLNLKGGKWKGCFHLPRALFQIWKSAERISIRSE
jgi:N-acylglucosamine 2-epimerase